MLPLKIEEINEFLKKLYKGKVEIVENIKIDKDGIEVELDSNYIDGKFNDQLKVLDKIFDDSTGEK